MFIPIAQNPEKVYILRNLCVKTGFCMCLRNEDLLVFPCRKSIGVSPISNVLPAHNPGSILLYFTFCSSISTVVFLKEMTCIKMLVISQFFFSFLLFIPQIVETCQCDDSGFGKQITFSSVFDTAGTHNEFLEKETTFCKAFCRYNILMTILNVIKSNYILFSIILNQSALEIVTK